jgi:hypothetical protein
VWPLNQMGGSVLFSRAVCSLVVAAAVVLPDAPRAEAVRAYLDSPEQAVATFCPSGDLVAAATSFAGYFTDPSEPFPLTGAVTYVRGVATNISGCLDDTPQIDFFLPEGGELAVSAVNPVICTRGALDGTFRERIANGPDSSCLQTPLAGRNGGAFFGFATLAPGTFLEIQVPVVFRTKLDGEAGPVSHRLTVVTESGFGFMAAEQPVLTYDPTLR